MNIHFISLLRRGAWGGSEELWSQAAARLHAGGHRVTACMKWVPAEQGSWRARRLGELGIAASCWGGPRPMPERIIGLAGRGVRKVLARGAGAPAPHDWAIPPGADLVVLSSPGHGFPPQLVAHCQRLRVPYVLVCQSVSESEWPADHELAAWRSAFQRAAAAFFVSHANLESTACQLAWRGDQFRVVSNPCNVDRSRPFVPPRVLAPRRIAFVGRLEPEHKGLDLLFRALGRPGWGTRDYQLNLYGTGRSARQVEEMAAYLGITGHLVFHGQTDCIQGVWEENELLVLPSRHEGLPLAVVEAMMCGRPCLVTDVSGNPEHVEDGRTGFIAAGATVNAVAEALERAWERRADWEAMGRAAYAAIRAAVPADPVGEFTGRLVVLAGARAAAG